MASRGSRLLVRGAGGALVSLLVLLLAAGAATAEDTPHGTGGHAGGGHAAGAASEPGAASRPAAPAPDTEGADAGGAGAFAEVQQLRARVLLLETERNALVSSLKGAQARLGAVETALQAERAAHEATRKAALEALSAATAGRESGAAPSVEAGAESKTTATATADTAAATTGPATAAQLRTAEQPALPPLPAPAPFSNAPPPRGGPAEAPRTVEAAATGSAKTWDEVPLRQRLGGDIIAARYTIRPRAAGAVVTGQREPCSQVELLNATTGRPFSFDRERYVLAERDQDARESYAALHDEIIARLPKGGAYTLYLAARASRKPFSRDRQIAASRRGLGTVVHLPRDRGTARWRAKPAEQSIPVKYAPEHLPLLRAEALREVIGKAADVSRVQLLEGGLVDDSDPSGQSFDLFLCVAWP